MGRKWGTSAILFSLVGLNWGITQAAEAPADTSVPVKAVVLYSSGVGFFEHTGTVNGDAETKLPFSSEQINDVLKSLVLEDSGGSVASVTYASQDPLAKTLQSFQIDLTGNPSLDQMLNQLRGSTVTVTLAGEQVSGTILGIEQHTKPDGNEKTYQVPFLNLVTSSGIRSIDMQEIRALLLDDQRLQEELNKALAAVAGARDKDKKPVTIHFKGQGDRRVDIGYVVQTPVWKTSYRLILDPKGGDRLQGWAIVENQTDNDWKDVDLTLVSGRPISFVEDLYQPRYITRPIVEPFAFASLIPRVYEGANSAMLSNAPAAAMQQEELGDAAKAPASLYLNGGIGGGGGGFGRKDFAASIISQASAGQLGDLFQYTIGHVSLPRQSSAMIPIVSDNVKVEQVSIYNSSVMPRNPLNGARLTNTTSKHLLAGPITVLNADSYAGDSQIEDLPPGQNRLLSYGIDLEMHVDAQGQNSTDDILAGKIVKGVLEMTHKIVNTTDYSASNQSDHDKALIIEDPVNSGWDWVNTPDPQEKTDTLYRFQMPVKAGKDAHLTVHKQLVQDQEFAILDGDFDTLITMSTNGVISPDVKNALIKAADFRHSIADAQSRLSDDKNRETAVVQDQSRIDETLRTIDRTTQLYARLLQKLNDQESQLEKLRNDEDTLSQKQMDLQNQLRDYLANLNVG